MMCTEKWITVILDHLFRTFLPITKWFGGLLQKSLLEENLWIMERLTNICFSELASSMRCARKTEENELLHDTYAM